MSEMNMSSIEVSREQMVEAVQRLPMEVLPEVAQFIEFVRFKEHYRETSLTDPELLVTSRAKSDVIRITRGLYADIPTNSDEFAKRKQIDIDCARFVLSASEGPD